MMRFAIPLLIWLARIALVAMTIAVLSTALSDAWGDVRRWFFDNPDKILHFSGMFMVTFGALLALPTTPTIWIWTGAVGLAATVELVQITGPRSADLSDFLFSVAGVLMAALSYHSSYIRARVAKNFRK